MTSGEDAIAVELVDSELQFDALRESWNHLEERGRRRSVFLRHEWFAAAWRWRGMQARMRMLAARRAGVVVGILPLIAAADGGLEFLTVPDTQVVDMLCALGDERDVAHAFAVALRRDRHWRVARLDPLSPDGACVAALHPALRQLGMTIASREAGRNYFIDLSTSWTAYYDTRSRSLKKALNLAANRLGKLGVVNVERIGPGDERARVPSALEQVIAISSQSWKTETGNSLDQPGPGAFIRALTGFASERGWLEIWLLHIDDKPVAMEYDIVFEGSIHALRADFVADNVQTSPGAHLFRVELERLFGGTSRRYYMGRGDNPYKRRWTEEGEPLRSFAVYNGTAAGRAAWLRDELVKPVLRRARRALRIDTRPAAAAADGSSDRA